MATATFSKAAMASVCVIMLLLLSLGHTPSTVAALSCGDYKPCQDCEAACRTSCTKFYPELFAPPTLSQSCYDGCISNACWNLEPLTTGPSPQCIAVQDSQKCEACVSRKRIHCLKAAGSGSLHGLLSNGTVAVKKLQISSNNLSDDKFNKEVQERWKCRMSTPERDRHLEQACSSSIELQELIPKVHGHGVTRCKRSEYQSQENQMLQEVNGHAQPRLIIRRVNEYYQSISYRTCKVMLYCFIVFTLSITAILTMAFGNARHVSIAVESATLARFVLDKSSPKLAYNFSFVLTVSNPNWAMSIENTKNLEVGIQFDGQLFDRILLMERGSKLHPLKTARYSVNTSSDGSFVALGNAGTEEFKKQNKAEMFELEVALSGQVRYFLHNSKSRLEASCPLKLYRVPAMTTWIMIDTTKYRDGGEGTLESVLTCLNNEALTLCWPDSPITGFSAEVVMA
ncbi:hypothetical protein PR202_ga11287 [Eleusine coracana subsp. coracana]|uniref:Late embryogenesis abundant protein LEA-2 subgroup domain-containing protein n=1 Tax=Eleusine coracana subsp. coracana TaxID=191504 RepID=A0AAV5C943_ELECO|nr:hypothetical protein PR202_ga11287 [Eleusine coracana subsp. coracana]